MNRSDLVPRIGIPVLPDREYPNYFAALEALGAKGERITAESDPNAFDGLLLPGGGDVEPSRYGRENAGSKGIIPELDELQLTATDRFFRAGKPILGICRGHQVLNVYFGGTLIQHIDQAGEHSWLPGTTDDRVHGTKADPDSWIGRLYGERFPTNSAHHQAVEIPGEGIVIDQYSEDGVVEAMHHATAPVYGVQWHPERMSFANRREDTVDGAKVLGWFVDLCREKMNG